MKKYLIPTTKDVTIVPDARLLISSENVGYTGGSIGDPVSGPSASPERHVLL